ncbi:MAG: homocysteine S-methyltransferase family protein [Clostridia bacterium]|nr:homocysteine S-methyltransferase family protein [Clostridia bacterium]
MNFSEFLKDNVVLLDGGMGTLLQAQGLKAGESPVLWNLTHPEAVYRVHRAYFEAGANVVCTNTFGANLYHFSEEELEKTVAAALELAHRAKRESLGDGPRFVALDIGPTGKLLRPLGDTVFEEAVSVFRKTVSLGVKYGAELIFIETVNDSLEAKAALLAAKEECELPVLVSCAFSEGETLMTGASPEAMVAMLESMGAAAVGANCSFGPKQLTGVAERMLTVASVPVFLKPNAGLPRMEGDKTLYDVPPAEFAAELSKLIRKGLRLAGGCCGTTPEYIKALREDTLSLSPVPLTKKEKTVISSYTHTVVFGEEPVLIGERINPTGKKRFKEALRAGDMNYILTEGIGQKEAGVAVLDVNVGLPEIDEREMLRRAVEELQAVLDLPLQIDTGDAVAMEEALRVYNGKALINSVNGKEESMAAIFPLVKKYGGAVIALTLDENGIPETVEGRLAVAKKILDRAAEYGIEKKDLIFDPLALTVSADKDAAKVTLQCVERIRKELSCHTSLGVSNVSFGLPAREAIGAAFFTMALERGLSAGIINPYSVEMQKAYYSFLALKGLDENCSRYLVASDAFQETGKGFSLSPKKEAEGDLTLSVSIEKGLKERAAREAEVALKKTEPLALVEEEIIPALNRVGEAFEKKTLFLPSLLMSAEAAGAAFEVIARKMPAKTEETGLGPVILATVKGDIHDIGKNILSLLMKNYGFAVIDLGKDVAPEAILREVKARRAPLVGLSALMTTTVPAMEETVALLKKEAPFCRVMVGGAVLTEDYAERIGADAYGRDAMAGVRYATELLKK